MTIKYIDLFAGIGGIRLGLEEALGELNLKGECVLSSEINKQACETYELNFNDYPMGDIKEISEIASFDILLAGFPCQPFSYAGKKRGFGDTRGTLFFEVERILKKNKPKAFLLENVRGLKTHDGGRTFDTIIKKLHELGYGTKELLLNSSNFNVPQNRVRLYILGVLGKTPRMNLVSNLGPKDSHSFSYKEHQVFMFDTFNSIKTVKDILEKSVDSKYYCSPDFTNKLIKYAGDDLNKLHGYRLIDYRGGKSLHSWELGIKGDCSESEIKFMNLLIQNRRKKIFGSHQDGKMLTLKQIKTFYDEDNLLNILDSLKAKGYIKESDAKYNPVCGNMSFEVFKFLEPK